MGSGRTVALSCVLATCFIAGFDSSRKAQGQELVEPAPLALEDAIVRALAGNPGIKTAAFDIEIERARRGFARLAQPLLVEAEVENFAGSGAVGGFDGAETTLQLSKVLELGGKRQLRSDLGDARVALAEIDREYARLALSAEVTRRFVDVAVRQEHAELITQAVGLAESTLEIVRRRVAIGRTSEAEQVTAEIALAQAELRASRAERELEFARLSLATLWGAESTDFERVLAEPYRLPATTTFAELKARLDDSPDLARLANKRRIREAERRLADARRRADLSVSVGLRHLGQLDDHALLVSVNMPLRSSARAAPTVAEADAELERLPLSAEQTRLELLRSLFELHQALEVAGAEYSALRDDLLPQAERAVELYRQGFELGSQTLLEFSQAQSQLLELRLDALEAVGTFHKTLVEIEYLLGGRYQTGAPP